MADLRDFTKKNTVFVGTDGIRLPSGNNAQRVASANVDATLRYNTDIGGMEVYSPNGWTPLAAPPSISTVSPSTFSGESGTSFEIQGTNINPDAQVYFVTSNGATLLAATITYFGSSQIRATTPRNISVAEEPLSVRLVQQSGTVTKLNCIDAGGHPDWVTTAGTLGSIFGANTVNVYVTATDPENTAVTYQLSTGSLPGGLNFTTSNGLIQGVASSVLANTTYNFTIRATDTVNNNTDRSFSYTVLNRAPVINTAAGSLGTIYSGNAASASISAYDPDGGNLTYAVASGSLPTNSSLGTANGVIQGTPIVVTTNTTYTFSISATDEGSLTASNTYTYTVLNRPPLWNTAATLGSYSPETFTPITVNAYDPDGGSITYSLTSGSVPEGLTFVSANATITGTAPEVTDNTTSTFTVTATDPGSDANTRTFSLTIAPIIDAQFSNTILLLKNSGNTVIRDASANNLPLTVVGDARASNFSPFNTSWSTYFGTYATNSYLTYVPGTSVAFGTGDFTVECFAYWDSDPGSTANPYIIDTRGGGGAWAFSWNWTGGSNGSVLAWTKADGNYHQASTQMPLHQWNHCAYVRSGTTGTIYLNGVSILSFTDSTNYSASISLAYLGKRYSGDQANPGYQSNLRIVKGTAVYLSAFTPPTSKLTAIANTVLLTHQTGSFKDNSTANSGTGFTITTSGLPKAVGASPFSFEETDTTTGSIYFDGTGDYISNLPSDLLDFGSSEEFSIEFFAYFNSVPNSFGMLGLNAGIQQGYAIVYDVGGGHYLLSGKTDEVGSASLLRTQSAGTLYPYKWHHICFARRSGVMSIYLDGVRVATRSSDTTTYAAGAATIGYAGQASATAMNGFMSNLRIVTGASAYDTSQTTLTVPTSPVSNISGTRLLTFQNRLPHNNSGFQDKSINKHVITRYGNASQGTFTPFSADPGKWSNYFNGSNGVRFADNAAFQFGSNAFTVEGWFNVASTPSNDASIISKWVAANDGNSSWMVDFQSSNLSAAISIGGSVTRITGSVGIPLSVWNHFALVRSGSPGTLSLFLNGNRIATGTPTGSLVDDSNPVGIGVRGGTDSYYLTGSLTNIRVVNGTALYDPTLTTHTVPTEPLSVVTNTKLLTCQNNRFIDNSTANSSAGFTATVSGTPSIQPFSPFAPNSVYTTANTGGSVYFDGTGDYLSAPNNTAFDMTGKSYCFETWVYFIDTKESSIFNRFDGTGGPGLSIQRLSSASGQDRKLIFYTGTQLTGVTPLYEYQWYHIAFTFDGTTKRIFVNGVLDASTTSGTMWQNSSSLTAMYIGNRQGDGRSFDFPGYMSGTRITKGSAVYTSSFTPPTAPPTLTANTTLLLNYTDAAIYDASGKHVIETVANAKSNNSISKFLGTSSHLDGDGDYLTLPPSTVATLLSLGSSNFTWECWVYRSAVTDSTYADGLCCSSAGITGFAAGVDPSGLVGYAISSSSGSWGIRLGVDPGNPKGSIAVALRTWTHIALVRNGSTFTGYVNGQVDQTFTSSSAISNLGNSYFIGRWHDGNTRYWNGNISDFRISKFARYTTTFTPPTRSFPNR